MERRRGGMSLERETERSVRLDLLDYSPSQSSSEHARVEIVPDFLVKDFQEVYSAFVALGQRPAQFGRFEKNEVHKNDSTTEGLP